MSPMEGLGAIGGLSELEQLQAELEAERLRAEKLERLSSSIEKLERELSVIPTLPVNDVSARDRPSPATVSAPSLVPIPCSARGARRTAHGAQGKYRCRGCASLTAARATPGRAEGSRVCQTRALAGQSPVRARARLPPAVPGAAGRQMTVPIEAHRKGEPTLLPRPPKTCVLSRFWQAAAAGCLLGEKGHACEAARGLAREALRLRLFHACAERSADEHQEGAGARARLRAPAVC